MAKHLKQKGISLLEIAIAMLIISTAIGSIVTMLPSSIKGNAISETSIKLDKIEKAIYAFYHQNGFIPCPASRTDLQSASNFGVSTDCNAAAPSGVTDLSPTAMSIRIGAVPVRTLNLPDDFMYDSFDMRINYSAIKNLAIDLATFNTANSNPADPFIINDSNSTKINQFPAAVYTSYLLWSSGKNRKGAYNNLGLMPVACDTSGLDYENCNLDNIFIDSPHNYESATYYDDYFRWRTNSNIVSLSGGAPNTCNTLPTDFTPDDIFGLSLWLDANDLSKITKDGSNNVSQWRDKSYYGFVFSPIGSNYPVYSATGFNNKPTITFNNKNGFNITSQTNPYSVPATNLTIFFAGHQNTTNGANYLIDLVSASVSFGLNLNMNGSNYWYKQGGTLYPGTTQSGNVYATWVFDDGANPEASLYINGVLNQSNNTFNSLSASYTCFNIAQACSGGGPTNFFGEISEVILYTRTLTTKERQNVELFLKNKWGL